MDCVADGNIPTSDSVHGNANKSVFCCLSTEPADQARSIPATSTKVQFDTDSHQVKVDTGCSVSLSGVLDDFVPGTLKPAPPGLSIQSYGGTKVPVTHKGTIRCRVEDDSYITRELLLPRSLYVPSTETRLLSPQHLAQVVDSPNVGTSNRTKTTMFSNHILLQWTKNKHKKTISLDSNNIGTLYTSPGYTNAQAFHAKLNVDTKDLSEVGPSSKFTQNHCEPPGFGILAYNATLVARDKKESQNAIFNKGSIMELAEKLRSTGVLADFETRMFKDATPGTTDFEETYADIRKSEDLLLLMHNKYGHISMKRLQTMAKLGMLPSRIKDCPIPICQSCLYGRMTRRQ